MKIPNISMWKKTASLGISCLFACSVAPAAQITWGETGAFSDNSVLALAGAVSNEVYGVDFGGSDAQTTANNYIFDDYANTGNMSIAGSGFGLYGGYMTGGATTGDGSLDVLLTYGLYGGTANTGTLNNLTVGQAYTVMALLDDTRGSAAGGSTFTVTDGTTTSPSQQYAFANGSPSVGGYIIGTFTADAATQAYTVLNGGSSQYNIVLLEKSLPPLFPPLNLVTNTQPATAAAGVGDQITFTAAFSNSPPVIAQWQIIVNGATNSLNTGVINVTNNDVIVSTLTLTNVQLSDTASYRLEAINATNSSDVAYSAAAPLTVSSLILWVQTGTFNDNSVLALAGDVSNEVYGVDFGGSDAQMTANGYTFDDYLNTGNMNIAGSGFGLYGGYLGGGGSTGDGSLDTVLTYGLYGGSANTGILNNLTVGQTYNVLALLADTRTGVGAQNPGTAFYGTDGVFTGPGQPFVFGSGTPAIGGYALGTFTALSTNQALSIVCQTLTGNYGNSQYNAVLLMKTSPLVLPPVYLAKNILPNPATAAEGGQITFTAAFRNIPALHLQWQIISNGVTNNFTTGSVATSTNNSIITSMLTLSNLHLSDSASYRLRAVNATNNLDVAYSSAAPLTVEPVITWVTAGAFTDNTVLGLAGAVSNEVYGVDFGGSDLQTTANGYTFDDYTSTGNMSIAGGGFGLYGGYLTGGATTGDAALDTILTYGLYGSTANTGTLNNLTVGQAYTVMALLDDTRGSAAGGISFITSDGVTTSPNQQYAFANGSPSVGGYIIGTFVATSTNQSFSVENYNGTGYGGQYNAILLESGAPPARGSITISSSNISGGNLILTGSGGAPGSGYAWLTTTNLSAPINWTTNATGTLDSSGSFSNSIPVSNEPARFFRLRLP